ncbi:MAG: hypothetical protein HY720_26195 [Planctomycetes bacterium]|nr:hypothetical protein [Planctomycetota bacterium]
MEVENFAVPALVTGLAWDGSRLWLLEGADRRVSTFEPAPGRFEPRFALAEPARAIAFHAGELVSLPADGMRILCLDPATGREKSSLGLEDRGAFSLVSDGKELWLLDQDSRRLSAIDPSSGRRREDRVLSDPVRSPAWAGIDLWALLVRRERPAKPFRWRGLAPGAGPFPPGPGSEFALVRIDAGTGGIAERFALPSEPAALAFDGRSFWYSCASAEGLERLEIPRGLRRD